MNAPKPNEIKAAHEIIKVIVNHYCDEIEKADLMCWRKAIRELREFTVCNYSSAPGYPSLYIDLPGLGGFQVIRSLEIDQAAQEYVEDIVRNCYLDGKDIPWWVEIDWERTAKNVTDTDGYAHTFGSYDGVELTTNDYYIFRAA